MLHDPLAVKKCFADHFWSKNPNLQKPEEKKPGTTWPTSHGWPVMCVWMLVCVWVFVCVCEERGCGVVTLKSPVLRCSLVSTGKKSYPLIDRLTWPSKCQVYKLVPRPWHSLSPWSLLLLLAITLGQHPTEQDGRYKQQHALSSSTTSSIIKKTNTNVVSAGTVVKPRQTYRNISLCTICPRS